MIAHHSRQRAPVVAVALRIAGLAHERFPIRAGWRCGFGPSLGAILPAQAYHYAPATEVFSRGAGASRLKSRTLIN